MVVSVVSRELVATVNLTVKVYLETVPGQSGSIFGTELPYSYLAIRDAEVTGSSMRHEMAHHVALLDHDDEILDVDGRVDDALREELSAYLPEDYRMVEE